MLQLSFSTLPALALTLSWTVAACGNIDRPSSDVVADATVALHVEGMT